MNPTEATLRRLLSEMVNLCAIGDVDETTEAYGWGEVIREAKAALSSSPEPSAAPGAGTGRPHLLALSTNEVKALAEYHDYQQEVADVNEIGCEGDKVRAQELRALLQAATREEER